MPYEICIYASDIFRRLSCLVHAYVYGCMGIWVYGYICIWVSLDNTIYIHHSDTTPSVTITTTITTSHLIPYILYTALIDMMRSRTAIRHTPYAILAYTHMRTHTHTHMRTRTHAHIHTHTYTYTHTHTYIQTHTHTRTQPACAIFRSLKGVRLLRLRAAQVGGGEHELSFELIMTNGVTRTYRLRYVDCEVLSAVFHETDCSYIKANPKVLNRRFYRIFVY
jgi:hypothetical protein